MFLGAIPQATDKVRIISPNRLKFNNNSYCDVKIKPGNPGRDLQSVILTVMNESENSAVIIEIRRMVHEMLGEIRQVKRHRNMSGGSAIL